MFCTPCQDYWHRYVATCDNPPAPDGTKWKPRTAVLHPSLRSLKDSSDRRCHLCRVLWHCVFEEERSKLLGLGSTVRVELLVQIDQIAEGKPSLAMRMGLEDGKEVFGTRMVATFAGSAESANVLKECADLPNGSTGASASFRMASYWLNDCLANHKECRKQGSDFLPTRLIDVGSDVKEPSLAETADLKLEERDRAYVALSHCWGKKRFLTTTLENISDHYDQIRFITLTKTFQDVVIAARQMGVRFVWIDSLCIIQNSREDWLRESVQMNEIYRRALFTIAPAHANSGAAGCFVKRDGLLQFPLELPPRKSRDDPPKTLFMPTPRLGLVPCADAPLYGRAWVLQEQILSPRLLFYDGSQLRWECLSSYGSEGSPHGGSSRQIGFMQSVRSGIMDSRADFFDYPAVADINGKLWQHHHFLKVVMDFTHRAMTNITDRLIAIAGIAGAIQQRTTNEYLAGLWRDQLPYGLLWSVPFMHEYTAPYAGRMFTIPIGTRHETPLAPSWSWASVTLPVVYLVPAIAWMRSICKILSAEVEGTPAQQTGSITLEAHARQGFVRSIYPSWTREAIQKSSHYALAHDDTDLLFDGGIIDNPNMYFAASFGEPKSTGKPTFSPIPGTFRADELLSPSIPLTFIAIAIRNSGERDSVREDDPTEVFTLALVPNSKSVTGQSGEDTAEFKRVGYAVWSACSWFGFDCFKEQERGSGSKSRAAKMPEKRHHWIVIWWDWMLGAFGGGSRHDTDTRTKVRRSKGCLPTPSLAAGKGIHEHPIVCDGEGFPNPSAYDGNVAVQKLRVKIV